MLGSITDKDMVIHVRLRTIVGYSTPCLFYFEGEGQELTLTIEMYA